MFALRPETALRIYTYAPDRHSLPVRQTLPPVRKTETEEETVRGLLLQIPARLRKVLTIINCGEATLLPPRFCFSTRRRAYFRRCERSVAAPKIGVRTPMQLLRRLERDCRGHFAPPQRRPFLSRHRERLCNYSVVWQRDCRGRFAPSQRRHFLFRHCERSEAIPRIGVRSIIILLHTNRSTPGLRTR